MYYRDKQKRYGHCYGAQSFTPGNYHNPEMNMCPYCGRLTDIEQDKYNQSYNYHDYAEPDYYTEPYNAPNYYGKYRDYGPEPFVVNIEEATLKNNNFRTALWTGKHLQITLMSINPGEDIGLEMHPDVDQFIRLEQGQGVVKMGDRKDRLDFQRNVHEGYAFVIPAGKWHNLINTGYVPIKLYSIYAPPNHPHGTVHRTKAEAEAHEKRH